MHSPPEHLSERVHGSASEQEAELFALTQPLSGLQLSVVQALSSSHITGVPEQVPPEHWSPLVQAFPSVQSAELLV